MDSPLDFDRLWDYSDPAATEQKFRDLLPQVGANSREKQLELQTQIARTLGLQKQFEAAHALLDLVEAGLDSAGAVTRQRYLLERGRVFNSAGEPARAQPLFLQAWELRTAGGDDFHSVDAAHMLGIVTADEEAIGWNRAAMALAEESTNPRATNWLGSLYNNLGWTYHDRGDFEEALVMFENGVARRELTPEAVAPLRIARWCVARAQRSLGRTAEALEQQEALLQEYEADGRRSGYVFEELAECHLQLGNDEPSRKFFALAWEELSQDDWLRTAEPDRLARLRELAGLTGDD